MLTQKRHKYMEGIAHSSTSMGQGSLRGEGRGGSLLPVQGHKRGSGPGSMPKIMQAPLLGKGKVGAWMKTSPKYRYPDLSGRRNKKNPGY